MALTWSEDLSIGNSLIDSEHKNLIVMVNNVAQALKENELSAISHAFEQLEHNLIAHFTNEEKLAQAIQFSFEQNESAHKYILKVLCRIRDAVASNNGGWADGAVEHYSEFLSDWLTNHVINEDMLLKPTLQTYPYDFNPV